MDSERGVGTKVRALFPAAGAPSPRPTPRPPAPAVGGNGTILVVDDEPAVLRASGAALERVGYEVLVARDGREALACHERMRDDIRLVLLDLTMPVLNGREVPPELRERAPSLPVIVMSGFTDTSVRDERVRFLRKPFGVREMLDAVR